ncbi:MAG: HAMP domain-containing histidine kinase [Defluviitaleaceae bacterium]|nr:HAMP domain-containing histidine kinase [Defluviitaleaceae bacterium]
MNIAQDYQAYLPWLFGGVVLALCLMTALFVPHYIKRREELMAIKEKEAKLLAENELLDRLSRLRVEFFQSISHDLKTPLTVISTCILNAADVLDFDEEINRDEMRESLGYAQLEIIRMARMVDSALKMSSLHDGRKKMKPLDIAKFLRDGAEIYRVLAERHKNKIVVDITQELPPVLANSDMLLHVLTNLLSNANRYTRDGEINIRAVEQGSAITITVADTGSGVDPDILPRIFERGVSDKSTGLGLSICKTIVEEVHGGTIDVLNKPGTGAAVIITLPVHIDDGGAM